MSSTDDLEFRVESLESGMEQLQTLAKELTDRVHMAERRLRAAESINVPPLKLDGTYSYEFEPQDVIAAQTATNLVKLYCGGIRSEAQRLGCLSHATQSQVCYRQPETDAQKFARMLYAAKYGYPPC